ncbi:hypothetical protein BGZ76_006024 [Entomortierella beljakovae]|nr:hypothetical protein BGZ76_006024 [Entomortierella beljakovae]
MTISKNISYVELSPSEYSQRTLGVNNGTVIETDQIKLVPLLLERDAPIMWETYKNHPELFNWMPHGILNTYKEFYDVQASFCSNPEYFNWVCYATAPSSISGDNKNEKKWVNVGSVALLDISLIHRRAEVGAVWFHPAVHGTFVVPETIYALVRFSFERLVSGRVQWKTHHKNIASQKAAIKLGFDFDGIFRNHIIHSDGNWRNTVYYSMTDDDWFGREEVTIDAKKGVDVQQESKVLQNRVLVNGPLGRQLKLESLIDVKMKEGKPLPATLVNGEPLN